MIFSPDDFKGSRVRSTLLAECKLADAKLGAMEPLAYCLSFGIALVIANQANGWLAVPAFFLAHWLILRGANKHATEARKQYQAFCDSPWPDRPDPEEYDLEASAARLTALLKTPRN